MSSVAKRMLEKMGWKEGEGLGKDREGVKSYVKVVRRDPKSAAGLGHIADPNTGTNLNTAHAIELDAMYNELRERKARKRTRASSDDDDEEGSADDGRKKHAGRSSSSSNNSKDSESSSDSSSSSRSDDDEEGNRRGGSRVDVTTLSDAELFKRCGGVRLGRAGRHRFFSGKLARIDASHRSSNHGKRESSTSDSE